MFKTRLSIKLSLAAFAMMCAAAPVSAKMNCEGIAGQWSGEMTGAYTGATSMAITNKCRINWSLPDGRTNHCRYNVRRGKVEYSCSLGSRGSVVISDGKIEMENIYTAHHGAYVVNVSKD